jgi:hypothetical protein
MRATRNPRVAKFRIQRFRGLGFNREPGTCER